jgi:hypothetical protein
MPVVASREPNHYRLDKGEVESTNAICFVKPTDSADDGDEECVPVLVGDSPSSGDDEHIPEPPEGE